MAIIRRFKVLEKFRHYGRMALIAQDECGFIMHRTKNELVKIYTFTEGEVVELTSPQDNPEKVFAYWVTNGPVMTKVSVEILLREAIWEEIPAENAPVS